MSDCGLAGQSGVGAPLPNPTGQSPRAVVPGAPRRAAVPASSARAEASRRNGAKSRGPKTPEGKARSAQNALKHGMRAHKHVLLPQEDAAEFAALEAALLAELAPKGALQTVLARRIVMAAWRLARADRMEAEALEVRSYDGANAGLALIRDGNGTRAFETLMRYRNAAMAEFTGALRTLTALQTEQAEEHAAGAEVRAMPPRQPPCAGAPRVPSRDAEQTRAPVPVVPRSCARLPSAKPAPARAHSPRARRALAAEGTRAWSAKHQVARAVPRHFIGAAP